MPTAQSGSAQGGAGAEPSSEDPYDDTSGTDPPRETPMSGRALASVGRRGILARVLRAPIGGVRAASYV